MASNLKKIRPEKVQIVLDKTRTLVYDLNAFAELEDQFGSIEEAMRALESGKIKAIIAILWAGLVHEDENLTPKYVGSIIGLGDLQQVADALGKAINTALPEADKGDSEGKN